MSQAELSRLMQSVGRAIFVRYYHEFSNLQLTNQDVADMLPSEYTNKSRTSRTSHARKIFRDGLHIEALEMVTNSTKVDEATVKEAQKLLTVVRREGE